MGLWNWLHGHRQEAVRFEVIRDEPSPIQWDEHFSVAAPRAAPEPPADHEHAVPLKEVHLPPILRQHPAAPPPPPPVPTEWARRLVGPAPPGRMRGVCSGCGTTLSISTARPLRIACPVCGRTKLVA